MVKVIVPTTGPPPPFTATHNNNGRGQQGVNYPGSAKTGVNTDSNNLDGGDSDIALNTDDMDRKDSAFRQELMKNDAAFLKRLTATDKAFRAKINTTTRNEMGRDTGPSCVLDTVVV